MDNRDEMLLGVFKHIAMSHFHDHKMRATYLRSGCFNRTLGQSISNYVRNNHPEEYAAMEEHSDRVLLAESKRQEE